jgi:chromosome segregation ATPase
MRRLLNGFDASILMLTLSACFLFTPQAQAQSRPAPSLTEDDLAPVVAAKPATPASPVAPIAAVEKGKVGTSETPSNNSSENPEQTAWNLRFQQAQQKLRELERQADKAEFEAIQIRNARYTSQLQDANSINDSNAQIATLTDQARQLRAEVKQAQEAVETIKKEGEQKNFKVSPLSAEKEAESLSEDAGDANLRQQVIQVRINQLHARIRQTTGSGDNFALNRLREELRQEEEQLEKSRQKAEKARTSLSELSTKAKATTISTKDQPE